MAFTAAFLAVVAAIVIWWLSHQQTGGQAVAGGRRDRRSAGRGRRARLDRQDRPRRLPRRRRLAVRALRQRLHRCACTWARTGARCRCRRCCGSTRACWSPAAWRCTGRRRAARGGRMDRRAGRPARGRCARPRLSGRAAPGMAAARCRRLLSGRQSRQLLLLSAHRRAWAARARRPRRLARATAKVWRGATCGAVRLSVELCAIYWHFLLFVWLVLFATAAASLEGIGSR